MLQDIGEFVRRLQELATTVPLDTLAVVVVGSVGLGAVGKTAWDRIAKRRGNEAIRLDPPPNGCNVPTHSELMDDLDRSEDERLRVVEQNNALTSRNARLEGELQAAQTVVKDMLADEGEMWQMHPPRHDHLPAISASRPKILTIANNKGGVGKTTLAVYLADYFRSKGKRVLVIDLDYQGSCTEFLLRAGRISIPENQPHRLAVANRLLSETPPNSWPAEVLAADLAGVQLITSDYTLTRHETHQMLRWLAQNGSPDVRYFLSDILMSPFVQDVAHGFDIVLIDAPPRLTTGAINALIASTHLLVPTRLDRLSAETVGSFLRQVWTLRSHMNLGLELAGVVGTLTPAQPLQTKLGDAQSDALAVVRNGLGNWRGSTHVFSRDIQERAAIRNAAGQEIAKDQTTQEMVRMLGDELSFRIGIG